MRKGLWAGVGSGIAAGASWGLVFLAPQLLAGFSPLQLAVSRYLAYGTVAALLLAPRWRVATGALGAPEWAALLRLSLLGNIVYYVLLGSAVQWAGGAATALIIGLLPAVVTVLGSRAAGAMHFRRLAAPCALCVLGVALVAAQTLDTAHPAQTNVGTRAAGLACAVGALACWSVYSIKNARWLTRRPDISGRDWSLLTGVVASTLTLTLAIPAFAFDHGHAAAEWTRFWSVAIVLGVFASVIGNACWNRASRLLPLTLVGQMIVFETVFALLYGFLWEARWPTPLESLAIACLLGGVLWCAWLHAPPQVRKPDATLG
ncbi:MULTISPECIES: DMT family transporter [Xanthomonas translucens group]|uniref:DMT family transporter n=1 Tax=Xanthomonas translucens group TaxID=3390202 RepID=UPI0005791FCC|nr:DMT family transporter [Xanthomonas translucens]UKE46528.1 DMT family transporter [Xanthomonas translucens pv. cerealis]UKE68868.1 DMT family transporter [Xanthomonas translucens pv. pistacia]